MEAKFNFKSQICTSREQSERLLALGLKKETADMWRGFLVGGETLVPTEEIDLYNFYVEPTPAWSLHRLLCIIDLYTAILRGRCKTCHKSFEEKDNLYDNIIDCIEWLIKEGYFNKEYLCEK